MHRLFIPFFIASAVTAMPAVAQISHTPALKAQPAPASAAPISNNAGQGDIETQTQQVMQQSSQDAGKDLRSQMDQMQKKNADKKQMRQQMQQMRTHRDGLSDTTQQDQTQMQQQMDAQRKAMSTMSNVMRKTGDTASGVTQNLK